MVDERASSQARVGARATSNAARGRVTFGVAFSEMYANSSSRRVAARTIRLQQRRGRTNERTSERSRQAGDARVRRVEARLGVSVRVESLNGFVVDASAARARGVFAADGVDPRALRSKLSSL